MSERPVPDLANFRLWEGVNAESPPEPKATSLAADIASGTRKLIFGAVIVAVVTSLALLLT